MEEKKDIEKILLNYLAVYQKEELCLKSTEYNLDICGPFLKVSVKRVLKNEYNNAIEASVTFPVPIQAAVNYLSYEVDGRKMVAVANIKEEARNIYEEAIGEGKTTVLHEELIRGIHMLSIGNIPAHKEVTVTLEFMLPVSIVKNGGEWIVPVSVGDIYGVSPLAESDDFKTSSVEQYADIILSEKLKQIVHVSNRVLLNKPIHITVNEKNINQVVNKIETGIHLTKDYIATIIPSIVSSDMSLSLDILCDISGSMMSNNRYSIMLNSLNNIKHTNSDDIQLWNFNTKCEKNNGFSFEQQINNMPQPSGGTEIGNAIQKVIPSEKRDILVITDGKSYALDVHLLAGLGRRISVIFIGTDSLEAKIGYLATLTGGQIYFLNSETDSINIVLNSLRNPYTPIKQSSNIEKKYSISYGGIEYVIELRQGQKENLAGSMVANLLLPYFSKSLASNICVSNNLVSALTSLVLVDEEGAKTDGMPKSVKIPLMQTSNNVMSANVVPQGIMSFGLCESSMSGKSISGTCRSYMSNGYSNNSLNSASTMNLESSLIQNVKDLFKKKSNTFNMDDVFVSYMNGNRNFDINMTNYIAKNINADLKSKIEFFANNCNIDLKDAIMLYFASQDDGRNAKRFLKFFGYTKEQVLIYFYV